MLRVAQVSFYRDPAERGAEDMLRDWPSLVDIAEAAATAPDMRISVIQRATFSRRIVRNGIDYHFVAVDPAGRGMTRTRRFAELIDEIGPDVFHVHGLSYADDVAQLAACYPNIPILLQDHATHPPRFFHRAKWRRALANAAGIAFCAREQATPFARLGLIRDETLVFSIPESTCRFNPGDRAEARRATGVSGDPCLLWVGHLNANKDPLTVLDGVSLAGRRFPGLELWCCYISAPQLRAVRARIARDPILSECVHLLGARSHDQIELLMRAADFFVLGSHREGSGYSLIEAMACGLPPIVTDIPSFREMTGAKAGRLWKRGDPRDFCAALCSLGRGDQAQMRSEVRSHFDRELSFAAVGRKWAAAYRSLRRERRTLTELEPVTQ